MGMTSNGKWGYRINNNSHYVRNRTYRPSSGIWLTKDILFYVFKTVNYYLYSENNPIVLFDFTGKDPEGVWIPRKPVNGTIKKNMIADCASGNRAVTQCDVNTGTTISLICDTPFEYKCGAERCLGLHEAIHRQDYRPCCKLVAKCINEKKASIAECMEYYKLWNDNFIDHTECSGLTNSVECCSTLNKDKCQCNDDNLFCESEGKLKNICCAAANGAKPACPFTADGKPDPNKKPSPKPGGWKPCTHPK